jgi:hypothetical protein
MQAMRRAIATVTAGALVLVASGSPAQQDKPRKEKDGFRAMFDLPRFVPPRCWIYNGTRDAWGFTGDGKIVCSGAGGGWLMTPEEYGDVEIRLEYKMAEGSNSGITVRCPRPPMDRGPEPAFDSYEIQLVDDDHSPDGKKATTCTGSIYGIVPALKRNVNKPLGEWNALRVVARGTKVTVTLNGEAVQDVDLKDHAGKVKRRNPRFLNTKGYIGLQSWRGRVEFRNLRVKELTDRDPRPNQPPVRRVALP